MQEPKHRQQKYPLPDIQPVLEAAKQRRLNWLEAMSKVSGDGLSEHERETKAEIILDTWDDEEQYP